jgi:putative flippase GtrA
VNRNLLLKRSNPHQMTNFMKNKRQSFRDSEDLEFETVIFKIVLFSLLFDLYFVFLISGFCCLCALSHYPSVIRRIVAKVLAMFLKT